MNMNQDLINKVYDKLENEYLNYVSKVKKLSVEEILEESYELTIKREFVDMLCDNNIFKKFQLLALLEKENPLQFLYYSWIKADSGIHNLLLEQLSDDFYKLGIDYEKNFLLKLQKDKNYNLIKDISDVLQEIDNYDFCYYIKEKFKVEDLDEYDVYKILNSKNGAKYLYEFLQEVMKEEQINYLVENKTIDSSKINKIETEILPKLKNIKQQFKEKERDLR